MLSPYPSKIEKMARSSSNSLTRSNLSKHTELQVAKISWRSNIPTSFGSRVAMQKVSTGPFEPLKTSKDSGRTLEEKKGKKPSRKHLGKAADPPPSDPASLGRRFRPGPPLDWGDPLRTPPLAPAAGLEPDRRTAVTTLENAPARLSPEPVDTNQPSSAKC